MLAPQQLRVLVAVHMQGSLSAAALALGYGVSTIAHHLAVLERHFEVQLVERDRHGARLTPLALGLVVVVEVEVEEILGRLAQAERLVTTQRDLGMTTIRVGTFASIGLQLLPRAIRLLRECLTVQVEVEVVEAEPIDVVAMVQSGGLHAGLIYDSVEDPAFATPDLDFTVLLEEDYRVLLAGTSPYAARAEVDLLDLAEVSWVCSRDENEASDRVLRRTCRAAGFEPPVLMRTDDLNLIHGLVVEGLGSALTTRAAVDSRFEVVLRPTTQDLGLRRTSFVRRGQVVPRAVEELRRS